MRKYCPTHSLDHLPIRVFLDAALRISPRACHMAIRNRHSGMCIAPHAGWPSSGRLRRADQAEDRRGREREREWREEEGRRRDKAELVLGTWPKRESASACPESTCPLHPPFIHPGIQESTDPLIHFIHSPVCLFCLPRLLLSVRPRGVCVRACVRAYVRTY